MTCVFITSAHSCRFLYCISTIRPIQHFHSRSWPCQPPRGSTALSMREQVLPALSQEMPSLKDVYSHEPEVHRPSINKQTVPQQDMAQPGSSTVRSYVCHSTFLKGWMAHCLIPFRVTQQTCLCNELAFACPLFILLSSQSIHAAISSSYLSRCRPTRQLCNNLMPLHQGLPWMLRSRSKTIHQSNVSDKCHLTLWLYRSAYFFHISFL